MALYSDLPVYKAPYDLLLGVFRFTKDFAREYKYTVGESMKKETIELLTLIYRANVKRDKQEVLQEARERYVCMDLGHSAQNLYLQTTAMGLITCAIGAFDDAVMQEALQLPEEEEILYLMQVGYRER